MVDVEPNHAFPCAQLAMHALLKCVSHMQQPFVSPRSFLFFPSPSQQHLYLVSLVFFGSFRPSCWPSAPALRFNTIKNRRQCILGCSKIWRIHYACKPFWRYTVCQRGMWMNELVAWRSLHGQGEGKRWPSKSFILWENLPLHLGSISTIWSKRN